jgi:dTDP-glucose 4,6-dehydratase
MSDECDPVNIGNPTENTVMELAEEINRITNNPAGIIVKKELRLGHDPQRRRPDITRARKILGWEPKVSLAEGIEKTLPYFRERMSEDA